MVVGHTSQTPASPDVDNGAAITTGARFIVDSSQTISGIAFYAPATVSGTFTGGLYETTSDDSPSDSGTGTLLSSGSLAAASVTPGAWNTIPLAAAQSVTTGHVYTCAVHSSSGRIVATGAGLASAISNGGVTLLANGTDPNPPGLGSMVNGVFKEGASLAYPVSAFNTSDYFIDVTFSAPSTVTGTAVANLGALSASASGLVRVSGAALASLGALSASASGLRRVSGTAVAGLGALSATALGKRTVAGAAASNLGAVSGVFFSHTTGRPLVSQSLSRRIKTVTRGVR